MPHEEVEGGFDLELGCFVDMTIKHAEQTKPQLEWFPTGSRVYGTPREDSDWDMVCWCPEERDLDRLVWVASVLRGGTKAKASRDLEGEHHVDYSTADVSACLYIGNLNIIAVTDKKEFELWRDATRLLMRMRPVTREFAVKFIYDMRRERGLLKKDKQENLVW